MFLKNLIIPGPIKKQIINDVNNAPPARNVMYLNKFKKLNESIRGIKK